MIVGVVADIHGNNVALAVVLDEFRRRNVHRVLFLGDLVGYYAFPVECLELLAPFEVTAVRGNHDQIAIDCMDVGHTDEGYRRAYGSALDRGLGSAASVLAEFLNALPLARRIDVDGRTLLMCHGSPWDPLDGRVYPDSSDWDRFESQDVDVVLLGHTHYPFARRCGPVFVLNPGSIGQPRHRSGVACAALLDVPTLTHEFLEIPYSPDAIIADAVTHDPGLGYLVHVLQR